MNTITVRFHGTIVLSKLISRLGPLIIPLVWVVPTLLSVRYSTLLMSVFRCWPASNTVSVPIFQNHTILSVSTFRIRYEYESRFYITFRVYGSLALVLTREKFCSLKCYMGLGFAIHSRRATFSRRKRIRLEAKSIHISSQDNSISHIFQARK